MAERTWTSVSGEPRFESSFRSSLAVCIWAGPCWRPFLLPTGGKDTLSPACARRLLVLQMSGLLSLRRGCRHVPRVVGSHVACVCRMWAALGTRACEGVGEGGLNRGKLRPQPISRRALEPGWTFGVVLHWGEGAGSPHPTSIRRCRQAPDLAAQTCLS